MSVVSINSELSEDCKEEVIGLKDVMEPKDIYDGTCFLVLPFPRAALIFCQDQLLPKKKSTSKLVFVTH